MARTPLGGGLPRRAGRVGWPAAGAAVVVLTLGSASALAMPMLANSCVPAVMTACFIGGGDENAVHDSYTFIGGGFGNHAGSADANVDNDGYSIVGGGSNNYAGA